MPKYTFNHKTIEIVIVSSSVSKIIEKLLSKITYRSISQTYVFKYSTINAKNLIKP